MNTTSLSTNEQRLVHAMQLLGDSTRFKMFKLLTEDSDMCVSEIASKLDISSSAVSQHFRNFEMLGLVEKERMGQKICYVLNEDDQLVKELKNITIK